LRSSSPSKGGERSEGGGSGLSLPPGWEPQIPFGVFVLVLILLSLALVALLLAALVPESLPGRRSQGFLHTSRIALAMTAGATLIAVVLVLFL
jgi:hypothetical protein